MMIARLQAALARGLIVNIHPLHDLMHYCKIVLSNTLISVKLRHEMGALDFRLLCSTLGNEVQSIL